MARHVLHVLANPRGGSGLSTLSLVHALRDRGVQSSIVSHRTADAEMRERITDAAEGRAAFVPLYRWTKGIRRSRSRRVLAAGSQLVLSAGGWRSTRRVEQLGRAWEVTLVHTTGPHVPEGCRVARALGLPHVWHVRELVGPGAPFRYYGERTLYPRRLRPDRCAFVANSRSAAQRLMQLVPHAEVEVVYNGLYLDDLVALELPDRAIPVVGMVAHTNNAIKRHEVFLHAAALAAREVDARFVVIGRFDPSIAYTRGLIDEVDRLGMTGKIEFTGQLAPPEAMQMLDILVHPTPSESCPRVVSEALAAGRPIVGVDAAGVGELIDHGRTGLLAAPEDSSGIAERIVRLARDPGLRAALGAEGRRVARERHSVEVMADRIVAVYERAENLV